MSTMRVLVLGGGPIGIGISKTLKDHSIPFKIYEAESDFGGVWNWGSSSSRVYHSTHLISPKKITQYVDYPMPDTYPDYPNHRLVLRYFRDYARHFGLYDHAVFNANVTRLRPVEDQWEVTTSDGDTALFSFVIVANGLQREPSYPDPAYPGNFSGDILHSMEYKHPDQIRDKRVLVVGAGNSGCDIASEAVHHASCVYHSTRRGYYYQPKYINGMPTPEWMLSIGEKFKTKQETMAYITQVFKLAGYDGSDYGLPEPDYPLDAAHPIMNSHVLYHIGHGDIFPRGDISSFDGRHVMFTSGSPVEVDMLIYATGFKRHLPFIDRSHLEWKQGIPDLFLHMVPSGINNMLFMGYINSAAGLGSVVQNYGLFAADYISASTSKTAGWDAFIEAKTQQQPDLGQSHYVESHRHLWEVDLWKYLKAINYYRQLLSKGSTT